MLWRANQHAEDGVGGAVEVKYVKSEEKGNRKQEGAEEVGCDMWVGM